MLFAVTAGTYVHICNQNQYSCLSLFPKAFLFIGDKIQAVGLKGSETQT